MAMGIKEIYSLILYYAFAWLAVSISVSESNVQLVVYFRSFFSSLLPLRFSVFCWGTLSMHRKFDRLFVYLLSFSILALIPSSVCVFIWVFGEIAKENNNRQFTYWCTIPLAAFEISSPNCYGVCVQCGIS